MKKIMMTVLLCVAAGAWGAASSKDLTIWGEKEAGQLFKSDVENVLGGTNAQALTDLLLRLHATEEATTDAIMRRPDVARVIHPKYNVEQVRALRVILGYKKRIYDALVQRGLKDSADTISKNTNAVDSYEFIFDVTAIKSALESRDPVILEKQSEQLEILEDIWAADIHIPWYFRLCCGRPEYMFPTVEDLQNLRDWKAKVVAQLKKIN